MADDPKTRARRRKGEDTMAPVSDLLKGLMRNVQSPLANGFLRLQLETQWVQVVGDRLAKLSKPVAYTDGILDVWVGHPTWMQELWYVKDDIRQKVNRHLGCEWCKEVRFTTHQRQGQAPAIGPGLKIGEGSGQ